MLNPYVMFELLTGRITQAFLVFLPLAFHHFMQMGHGRRRDAAVLLGWGRNTLTRKINELNMDKDDAMDDAENDDNAKEGQLMEGNGH